MSRFVMAIAVAVVVASSGAAFARGGGGGGHGGGGHGGGFHGGGFHGGGFHGGGFHGGGFHGGGYAHFHGGGHFAHAHVGGGRMGWHGGHGFRTAAVSSGNIRTALNSFSHGRALHNARILSNPAARAQLAAGAAVIGWHGGAHGWWWRHPNGGFGWVGPLFWPFAYYDIYDYTLWGYGPGFWGYGYVDIYAGLFGPYGYGGLAGYLPPSRQQPRSAASSFAQMCADDGREVAGLPIDQIGKVIEPNEIQRAALDDLAGASIKAAQTIRASCPTQVAATAPGRLAAMQQRIEAMVSGVALVRPPLERLYGLLDDEQKARFNAMAEDERKKTPSSGLVGECGGAQTLTLAWPADEIENRLHPNDTQRAALGKLQDAAANAADTLKTACQPADMLTPTLRLDAIAKRLDTMLQVVKSVRSALDDFYATLSDEQKAQFEAIGPRRTS